jgi:hypothetical protein
VNRVGSNAGITGAWESWVRTANGDHFSPARNWWTSLKCSRNKPGRKPKFGDYPFPREEILHQAFFVRSIATTFPHEQLTEQKGYCVGEYLVRTTVYSVVGRFEN